MFVFNLLTALCLREKKNKMKNLPLLSPFSHDFFFFPLSASFSSTDKAKQTDVLKKEADRSARFVCVCVRVCVYACATV